MRSRLRTYFLAGLLVFLPVAVTVGLFVAFFEFVDGQIGYLLTALIGRPVPGLGFLVTILVIFGLGVVATNVLGRQLVEGFDRVMLRIPFARSIYSATKQISDSILLKNKAAFRRAVLIEWPRKGLFTVGFVTGETPLDPKVNSARRLLHVFVVGTPNPTTGFLMLIPEDEVHSLDMSIEEALKLVISGGIVGPPPLAVPSLQRGAAASSSVERRP